MWNKNVNKMVLTKNICICLVLYPVLCLFCTDSPVVSVVGCSSCGTRFESPAWKMKNLSI